MVETLSPLVSQDPNVESAFCDALNKEKSSTKIKLLLQALTAYDVLCNEQIIQTFFHVLSGQPEQEHVNLIADYIANISIQDHNASLFTKLLISMNDFEVSEVSLLRIFHQWQLYPNKDQETNDKILKEIENSYHEDLKRSAGAS